MKIGIDARMYGQKQTGIGNYIKNLFPELLQIDQENEYQFFVLKSAPKDWQLPAQANFIPVSSGWYTFSEQLKFWQDLRKQNLDLVHFPHFNVPRMYAGKFVVTVHDITQNYYPGYGLRGFLKKQAYKIVFKTAIERSRQVIAASEFTKQDIIDNFVANPRKIKVIYPGLDPLFKKLATEAEVIAVRQRYALPTKYLLYAGVWREHKNIIGLLKAFQILKKRYQIEQKLVLLGEEDARYKRVHQTIRELGLSEQVETPGFLDFRLLPAVFKGASLYILPSWREGFGFTPLEALSQETPVVVSSTTCLPEILGESAVYFDPHNPQDIAKKVWQVINQPDLQTKLLVASKSLLPRYSWQQTARQTLEIYNNV